MPCPKCGSNSLWDDNMAWGCNRCPFFTTGDISNTSAVHDTFGWNPSPDKYKPEPVYTPPPYEDLSKRPDDDDPVYGYDYY